MHCIKCGTLAAPGAQFCFKCGAPLVDGTSATNGTPATPTAANRSSATPATAPKKPSPTWMYIVGALLIGVYAAEIIPALNDQPGTPSAANASWLFTGLFFYLWWKRRGKKGWHGFLIGAVVGVLLFIVAAFIRGYLHALHGGPGG